MIGTSKSYNWSKAFSNNLPLMNFQTAATNLSFPLFTLGQNRGEREENYL